MGSIPSTSATLLWLIIIITSIGLSTWLFMYDYHFLEIIKKNILHTCIPLGMLTVGIVQSFNPPLDLDCLLFLWSCLILFTVIVSVLLGYLLYHCILYSYIVYSLAGSKNSYLDAK
jgi:hypothetical protein